MGVVRRFVGALLLGAVVLVAAGFATGRLASVVTNGVSMLPAYEAGDLVVVARADRYTVGDVVAYREPESREVVLHRIVGGDADAFEVQGDNNESVDTTTPGARDLIGRQVLHVPTVGRWIGSPLTMACLAGLLLGLSSMLTLGGGRRRDANVTTAAPSAPGAPAEEPSSVDTAPSVGAIGAADRSRPRWRWWHRLLVLADLGVVAGLVAALAVPPTVVPPPPVPTHLGSLSYSAEVAVDDTYPDGRIDTGDTVFLRLVDRVGISFVYEGDPALAANARLRAMLVSAQGWSTSVALAPVTPVVAGGAELHGVLDLGQLRSMLDRVTDATAIPLTNVELRVEAIVDPESDGPESDDADVTTSVTELVFRFDDIVLDLVDTAVISETATGPAVATSTPVRETAVSPTEVGGVPRSARRWLVVALLVLVAATATAWPTSDRRRESTSIDAGHPVPATIVSDVRLPSDRPLVRLAARADLEQLARATGASMLLRDDGWCAVVAERAVHWWAPADTVVVPAAAPVAAAVVIPPAAATPPVVIEPAAMSAVSIPPVSTPPDSIRPVSTLDDLWAIAEPRFADDLVAGVAQAAPVTPPARTAVTAPVAAHELPTAELRLDVVDQLRDDTFVPRRPLFGSRRPTSPTNPPASPPSNTPSTRAPVTLPPPRIVADGAPVRPTPPPHDPLRTTIDEIVKYLSEVAPPPPDGHVRPQGGGRDLAS